MTIAESGLLLAIYEGVLSDNALQRLLALACSKPLRFHS